MISENSDRPRPGRRRKTRRKGPDDLQGVHARLQRNLRAQRMLEQWQQMLLSEQQVLLAEMEEHLPAR